MSLHGNSFGLGFAPVSGELRGQDEGIVDSKTQQQEVEVVVQVASVDDSGRKARIYQLFHLNAPSDSSGRDAVRYLEVAHEAQRGGHSEAYDGHCHKGHGHPRVHRVALAQHDLGKGFRRDVVGNPSVSTSTGLHFTEPVRAGCPQWFARNVRSGGDLPRTELQRAAKPPGAPPKCGRATAQ